MSDREQLRRDFLTASGLGEAARAPPPGDASTRPHERLTTPAGATLMLMDQPPATESRPCDPAWTPEQRRAAGWNAVARLSAGRIEAFAAVAEHFRHAGLSTPETVAADAVALRGGADLFIEWLPKLHPDLEFGPEVQEAWRAAWAPVFAMGEQKAWTIAHRDYHAENLIWLPDRPHQKRGGLIDFQDAVLAHPVCAP